MSSYDLDPGAVRGVATATETGLSDLETHRSTASAALDEAAASGQSPEVASALINVWNVTLAPQFEGAEQRLAALVAGLRNLATAYDDGNLQMMDDAVSQTDAAVDVVIDDAKQA